MSRLVTGQAVLEWYYVNQGQGLLPDYRNCGVLGWEREDKLVAAVVYESCNGANTMLHVTSTAQNWLTRPFLAAIFHYGFEIMGARRLTGCVLAANIKIEKLLAHLGFTREAVLEGAHPSGDVHFWRMWKSECKWIRREFLQRAAPERLDYVRECGFGSSASRPLCSSSRADKVQ